MSYSHVRAMVEFAISLMGKLEAINTHSFNVFKLRIGESDVNTQDASISFSLSHYVS